jgi:hypothetical protein
MDRATFFKAVRSPLILAIVGGTVVVLLIWLVAIFLPQGSKVNKLNAQAVSLQSEQNDLNAKVAQLKKLKNAGLERLHNQYTGLVPPAPDTAQYLKQINAIVSQSGAKLQSVSIAAPAAPAAAPAATPGSGAAKSATSSAITIGITLTVQGTYDEQLRLIQLIYSAPRLTTINTVALSGGGPTSTRTTPLNAGYTLTIYELPGSVSAPTTTTTAAA